MPKCENSETAAANMVATPASTAFPPWKKIRIPASVAYSLPPATAPWVPRAANMAGCSNSLRWAAQTKMTPKKRTPSLRYISYGHYSSARHRSSSIPTPQSLPGDDFAAAKDQVEDRGVGRSELDFDRVSVVRLVNHKL